MPAVPNRNGHISTQWQQSANDAVADVRERLEDVDVQIRSFVREKPLVAVGVAVAAGFLVGRLLK